MIEMKNVDLNFVEFIANATFQMGHLVLENTEKLVKFKITSPNTILKQKFPFMALW